MNNRHLDLEELEDSRWALEWIEAGSPLDFETWKAEKELENEDRYRQVEDD